MDRDGGGVTCTTFNYWLRVDWPSRVDSSNLMSKVHVTERDEDMARGNTWKDHLGETSRQQLELFSRNRACRVFHLLDT
jgi:hypothetical protein